ncbi:MAG: Type secretion system domain protein [Cyanobacteria bacterium RYN_339]|nr:Type secretion system domain protein [Cyanobacteria bacterium RYN_339]
MTALPILMGGLTAALLAYAGLQTTSRAPALAARFQRYAGVVDPAPPRATWLAAVLGFMVEPLYPLLMRLWPGTYLEAVRGWLRQTGHPSTASFQLFLVCQALAAALAGMGGLALGGDRRVIIAGLAAVFALLLPVLWLRQAVRRRQTAIEGVLCDSLDLLTASVEAGLGLDAAIAQLVRRRNRTCFAINQELGRYLQELRIGTPRGDALRNLGSRSGVEDLRQVVTALVHGDSLGIGVSQVLRAQAKHLRLRRKQRAEEKAMKAPIKILFPLLFGIFPSIFVLILGPALLRLVDAFAGKF